MEKAYLGHFRNTHSGSGPPRSAKLMLPTLANPSREAALRWIGTSTSCTSEVLIPHVIVFTSSPTRVYLAVTVSGGGSPPALIIRHARHGSQPDHGSQPERLPGSTSGASTNASGCAYCAPHIPIQAPTPRHQIGITSHTLFKS